MKAYEAVGTPHFAFEFTACHLAIDFANTVGNRHSEAPIELLPRYSSLVAWAEQARLIGRAAAARLKLDSARCPGEAEVSRVRALAMREALHSIFESLAADRLVAQEPLSTLNACLSDSLGRLRVRQEGRRLAWDRADEGSLESIVWPIAQAAAELLTSPLRAQVKHCAAADCRWLFLDLSRNRRRRWCDMALCGNRAKNSRYYHRHKKRASARRGRRRSVPPSSRKR